jgi:hypothetical protein
MKKSKKIPWRRQWRKSSGGGDGKSAKEKQHNFFYQDRADSTEPTEESWTGAQEAEPSQETKSEP